MFLISNKLIVEFYNRLKMEQIKEGECKMASISSALNFFMGTIGFCIIVTVVFLKYWR